MIIEEKREMEEEIRIPRLCSVFSHSWGDNCGFLKRVVLSFFSVETSYFSEEPCQKVSIIIDIIILHREPIPILTRMKLCKKARILWHL